nr:zinc finger, CCHC-type, retrotransposon Gag domain protein [Tanacetum cinerariifolium]
MFLGKYFPPSMVTKLKNEITNSRQRPDESLFKAWECYKLSIDQCPNHNMLPVTQIDTFYNGLILRHRDTINAAVRGTFMKRRPEECYVLIENMTAHHNDWDTSAQRTTVGNTQNVYAAGVYQVVERKTEATKDMVHPTNDESIEDVQSLVVLTESLILNSEPVISPIIEPVASPMVNTRTDAELSAAVQNALQTLLPQICAEIREEFRTGSKDLTCEDWMVNTCTDAELSAAVQNALQTLLPQICAEIHEEFRTGSRPLDSGGNPPPVTIHTWLERFNKQKPRSFEKATAPVDAENWISHMEKIFGVMGCEDAFKTRLAVYKFEGNALAW